MQRTLTGADRVMKRTATSNTTGSISTACAAAQQKLGISRPASLSCVGPGAADHGSLVRCFTDSGGRQKAARMPPCNSVCA